MQKITLPIEEEKKDFITPTNPDFSWMGKMIFLVLIIIIIIYGCIYIFSSLVIKFLPIEKEKEIFGGIINHLDNFEKYEPEKLKNLFFVDDNYSIYINNSNEVNAFATIGGNILINKGLIDNLEYEEELLFIIGHEMKHIEDRHILKSISRDIPFTLALKLLGFEIDLKITNFSEITSSYLNRKNELDADDAGAEIINGLELNLGCSLNFFKDEDIFSKYLDFIGSHPNNKKRVQNLEKQIIYGEKDCTPLNYDF